MIDALRHLPPAEDDPFQVLSGDQCALLLCCIAFIGYVLRWNL